jgi:hypothetical protein
MIINQVVEEGKTDGGPTNAFKMRTTRPTRRSPIRLLSASRNSSLKASRSLNRMAGPSLGAGGSFKATDHRATGERTPPIYIRASNGRRTLAVAAVGERVGPRPCCGERSALQRSRCVQHLQELPIQGADVQVERIGDLVELDRPAFAPNGSKGAQP